MSEPKTRPTRASALKFAQSQEDPVRRQDCLDLIAMMREASGAEPVMWGDAIVGFGRYLMTYANGSTLDWPMMGFSPRKGDLTLYLLMDADGQAERMARLGKHKASKACLYIKRLDQVDRGVLREMIEATVAGMAERRTG